MADKYADIAARMANVAQLQAVVTAMRGIAAARAQHGRALLPAIDAYGTLMTEAIGRATLALPTGRDAATPARRRTALIVFCAEEGFAGSFSERILDVAEGAAPDVLSIVGTRGAAIARERGMEPDHVAMMPSHVEQVQTLAADLVDNVYTLLAPGAVTRLEVVYNRQSADGAVAPEWRSILPPESVRPVRGAAPLTTLDPVLLMERLATEYVFAALCHAAMHAYVSENEARLRAMAAARTNIEQRLTDLSTTMKTLRQEEITAEIIEICAGAEAARV